MNAKTMIMKVMGKPDGKLEKYGKVNNNLAYELTTVDHRKFDYSNEHATIIFVENQEGKLIFRNDMTKIFYPETESNGGRFVGKYYKSDLELAYEFLRTLVS